MEREKGIDFLGVVSFIGAVLILIGVAWIIASNWHIIPDALKIMILVAATALALIIGAVIKGKGDREFTGRSLLLLGGGLYVLSVFLISQILFSHSSDQGVVNLILLCWPVLFLIAYFLDSKENIIFGLTVFGVWVISQFMLLVDGEDAILATIVLFVIMGALLYGLKLLHEVYDHRFYKLYNFWTAFYVLLGAFILTFQTTLSIGVIRGGSEGFTNPFFLIIGLGTIFFFVISVMVAMNRKPEKMKEISIFIGRIFVILVSVFLIKASGLVDAEDVGEGYCMDNNWDECMRNYEKGSCEVSEGCVWTSGEDGRCNENYSMEGRLMEYCVDVRGVEVCHDISCNGFSVAECGVMNDYGCYWRFDGECARVLDNGLGLQACTNIDSKASCEANDCSWRSSRYNYGIELNWFSYILWLAYNVFFIGLIILMIGYGKEEKQRRIVDIAFLFFVFTIICRYVGFAMDLVGYLGFSIIAIIGGAVLIGGAYLVQKYWRKEVNEMKEVPHGQGYAA